MQNKIISKEHTRIITKGIAVEMVNKIMGILDLLTKDFDDENLKFLHAKKKIFIATCEEELELADRITIYTYAKDICLDKLMNRAHTKKLRKSLHKWCYKLEARINELNSELRCSPDMLITAMNNSLNVYKEKILQEYNKLEPDYVKIDRCLLMVMDINAELTKHKTNSDGGEVKWNREKLTH